ncbi:hypothetical protein DNTS_004107 [Danionella cerebrum]|uniref:Proteoglycan 4 n=1 Tax=Danionella cerebrum TaxID=2873325 RepID=A0A553MUJ4_9TELE|nr:hypothetical protein DNTS_004107 [Danionella translucida]
MTGPLVVASLLSVLCVFPPFSAAQDYTDECMAACLAAQQNPDLLRQGTGLDGFVAPSDAPTLPVENPSAQDSHDPPMGSSDLPGSASSPPGSQDPAPGDFSKNPLIIPLQVSFHISAKADEESDASERAGAALRGSERAGGHDPGSERAFLPGSKETSTPAPDSEKASAPTPGSERASGPALGSDGASTTAQGPTSPKEPDSNLCSGLAIDGMAALVNGSVIVFRGHFFWLLNPKTKKAGPARRISDELGVPSPIDTAFTRCNCQGKTYIIKGDQYWSLENGAMEAGQPRSVSQDFGGLSGEIKAALSVPATRKRPETIYFFKKGGTVQKLSFPPGTGTNCSGKRSKNPGKSSKNGKQGEIQLSGEINMKLKMKGFPTSVTSALSMPNPKKAEGFDYLVFSWPKVLNVKISGDLPALTAPASHSSQQSNINKWLPCA